MQTLHIVQLLFQIFKRSCRREIPQLPRIFRNGIQIGSNVFLQFLGVRFLDVQDTIQKVTLL